MGLLHSRSRRRFTPVLEALEDRFLPSATVASQQFGTIATTDKVNHVVITDDGSTIQVFSDNGLITTFGEGTDLTVVTLVAGSRNQVEYDLLGTPAGARNVALRSSLNVQFGFGHGSLDVRVTAALPSGLNVFPGPLTNLGANSNVQISTKATDTRFSFFRRPGGTEVNLNVGGIGANTILSLKDVGGGGKDSFAAGLFGSAETNSQVTLTFFGNGGNDIGQVFDSQNIQENATTAIDLHGGLGNDTGNVTYGGRLQGNLLATDDGGPGIDALFLRYDLQANSFGFLTSQQRGGPDNDTNLVHIIHKVNGDNPDVLSAFTNGGPGFDKASITNGSSPTNLAVATSMVESVVPVG